MGWSVGTRNFLGDFLHFHCLKVFFGLALLGPSDNLVFNFLPQDKYLATCEKKTDIMGFE